MFRRAAPPQVPAIFADLPITLIHSGSAGGAIAVHVHGTLRDDRIPIVCLPGYLRNMSDFSDLPVAVNGLPDTDFAFILLDLAGRGRSASRKGKQSYSTLHDADCVLDVLCALDIPRAVLLGQGHGGQVAMVAASKRPSAIAATILVDSGPVTDPRGLVRSRNNYRHLTQLRGETAIRDALRKILAADYPGDTAARLDLLAERLYRFDQRGRIQGLFDPRLIEQIEQFDFDDVLEPQWQLFDCLIHAPLMIVRTQLSDQLRRTTFEEMMRLRHDAATLTLSGQGSPALLEGAEERDALAQFLRGVCRAGPEMVEDQPSPESALA